MSFAAAARWGLATAPQRRTATSLKSSCRIKWTHLGIKEPVWSLISNSWRLSTEERAAKKGAAFPPPLPLCLPCGWILHLPAMTTANNDDNNNKGPNCSVTKTCPHTVFFILLWSSRPFKVEIIETTFDASWDEQKWKRVLQPQSFFFLKCFDLSFQSARVTSSPLLAVSQRLLIKARRLAGCPWSARSKLRHESGIQRRSSMTFFWLFRCSYRWNRTCIQRSPFAFIKAFAQMFSVYVIYFFFTYCSFTWKEKLIGRKLSRNDANHIDFSISFI